MITTQETREERGLRIAESKEPQVQRVEENFYTVKSQSGNGEYAVSKVDNEVDLRVPRQQVPTRNMQAHSRRNLFSINESRSGDNQNCT